MRYLADTNVILRLVHRRDPLHMTMRGAVRSLHRDGHQVCLVPQNCVEFWNVATRPVARNGYSLSIDEADTSLRLIERLFSILPDQPAVYGEWRKLVVQFSVAGVQVHDARLVAAMRVHGITHIVTANINDFTRYASIGIVAVHPAQI
ncbi:MAG TPA: type II toxin-antitoxin system VapC family toxin [Herpetosiphonaceae bacterium]